MGGDEVEHRPRLGCQRALVVDDGQARAGDPQLFADPVELVLVAGEGREPDDLGAHAERGLHRRRVDAADLAVAADAAEHAHPSTMRSTTAASAAVG